MWLVSALDWTQIIVAGIGAFGAVVSATVGALVLYAIRLPSGGRIGAKVEQTHELAAVNATAVAMLNGGTKEPERDTDKDAA